MKIVKTSFNGRQYMMRRNFELLHLCDRRLKGVSDHYHNYYEVYFLNSGADVEYQIEGVSYTLRPGDILIINCFDVHKSIINVNSLYDRVVFWIDPQYLRSLGSKETNLCRCFENTVLRSRNLIRLEKEALYTVKSTLGKLEKAYFGENFGNDLLIESHIREIMIMLNRACLDIKEERIESDICVNKIVESALRLITENLSADLSLDRLSNELFVSKYHLSREFKKNVGYTIHQYITLKRLLMAEELLLFNDVSVTEVCTRCGFRDYSNFIRTFTKYYGMPPGQFSNTSGRYTGTVRVNDSAYDEHAVEIG
ncbi:MAG: helix-turn-helix domain-containing protein [Clostridiales Family XIII bacterium]|nr:helix-turn-helix domain-containing protein [Clostridiales Family XIII bacterium]